MTELSANSQDSARHDWQSPRQTDQAVSVGVTDIRVTKRDLCPECGVHVASGAENCSACGESMVHVPKQIRCMHCHTTCSSELVVCSGCGRELREAPPKLMTVGAPVLVAVLLVAVLITQWGRISPITWARTNLVRGVVLVEGISASIEPEVVIVMTPIVQESNNTVAFTMNNAAAAQVASEAQTVAMASATDSQSAVESAEPEVLAASVVQEPPFGVGGPQPPEQVQVAASEIAPNEAVPTEVVIVVPPTATVTPLPPTATATQEPTPVIPTPTLAPTEVVAPTESAAKPAGVAASSNAAANDATSTPFPTPTWTVVASLASPTSAGVVGGVAQVAALASETTLPTPTSTPTRLITPLPTPTATPVVYQVRAGDTLVTIASTYGVDVDALMEANEISAQDVYVIQPGQMLYVPVPTPEPVIVSAIDPATARVEAPQLLIPSAAAQVGCATGGTLIWQRVQFVKDSDKYVLHLGFVSGREANGQEIITWILAQSGPVTLTEWQLDTALCDLAPADYDHQWRWWVEVVEDTDGGTVSVSPPSEIRGFTWK